MPRGDYFKLAMVLITVFSVRPAAPALPRGEEICTPMVKFFVGKVRIRSSHSKSVYPVSVGMKILKNHRIQTYRSSFVEVSLDSSTTLIIDENAEISYDEVIRWKKESSAPSRKRGFIDGLKKIFRDNNRINSINHTIAVKGDSPSEELLWEEDGGGKGSPVLEEKIVADYMAAEYARGHHENVIKAFRKNRALLQERKDRLEYLAGLSYLHLCAFRDAADIFMSLSANSRISSLRINALFQAGLACHCLLELKRSNEFLTRYITTCREGDLLPHAHYIRGLNYVHLKRSDLAKKDFARIRSSYSDSSLYADADLQYKRLSR